MNLGILEKLKPKQPPKTALDTMISEYESPLLRYVRQLLWPDDASCQDVVQSTFMKCHSHIRKNGAESLANPRAWLYRVAHNLSMDILRSRKRQHDVEEKLKQDPAANPFADAGTDDFSDLEKKELYQLAMDELNQLPEDQRQILLLKHIQGLTLREIAEITGFKIGTVNYKLTQGLSQLAQRLTNK